MMPQRLLLLVSLLLASCSDPPEPAPAPRPVLYAVVHTGSGKEQRFAGSIQARYETVLSFRTGGRIASRIVEVGAAVSAGDLLATLDPTDQQNSLQSSEGEMASAQAQWQDAQASTKRQLELVRSGVGAKANLDAAQTREKTTRAALEQRTADARQARDQLAYTQLSAEFAAVVTVWHAEVGQVISPGQPVVTLARPDIKEAVLDLPDAMVDELPADALFHVAPQLAAQTNVTGAVRQIAPQADAATRMRRVWLTLEGDTETLHLGTTVTARLANSEGLRTRLPDSAVLRAASERSSATGQVWVIDPVSLKVQRRDVQLGNRHEGRVTVISGLRDGEWVVRAGANSLTEGQLVKLAEEDSP